MKGLLAAVVVWLGLMQLSPVHAQGCCAEIFGGQCHQQVICWCFGVPIVATVTGSMTEVIITRENATEEECEALGEHFLRAEAMLCGLQCCGYSIVAGPICTPFVSPDVCSPGYEMPGTNCWCEGDVRCM